jgi:pimeloyl-ACP methyl ester carboxylesterase
MSDHRANRHRLTLVATVVGLAFAVFASPAMSAVAVRLEWLDGFEAPGTPAELNQVGVLEIGPRSARNILVLNPGTSASAAYFAPLAKTIVSRVSGWQVWAVERRENLLEDHSMLDRAKAGAATNRELFDYYLGWLADPSVTDHFELIADSDVGFAREWGMRVEIEDLRRVVKAAKSRGGKVVLGGHSLGGSITAAYATWDFDGEPGVTDLAGLVFIDGGSSPTSLTPEEAMEQLQELADGSPWLAFGGIEAPFAGLFNSSGSTGVLIDPDSPSLGQAFPLLPENLKPPIPVTNIAQYGYALDTETSPPSLAAAQAHLGRLAASGDPRGWDQAGEITPIRRFADMFSGTGLPGLDGTAWYHPLRLTIDSRAVAAGNANPAQEILDVRATHGHDLPRDLQIYAFGAALGGQRVLDAAVILAEQSGIPARNLMLIDRHETYSHNDPNSASPKNEFVDGLVRFLGRIDGPRKPTRLPLLLRGPAR